MGRVSTACLFLCFAASAYAVQLVREPAPEVICPEDDPNGTFRHDEYCDKYYECAAGEAILVTCPDGLLYSDDNRSLRGTKCDEPFNLIDCGNRTLLQEPKPSEDGVCPRQNGRFEHQDPTVCDQYIVCRHGSWTLLNCAPGLYYSPEIGQCTWPDQSNRKNCGVKKNKLPDGFECPDSDTSALPAGSGPRNPNPTYPHPTSCTKFYVCIAGLEPRLNVCNADLVYNIETGTCDTVENVPECAPVEEGPVE